MKIRLSKNNKSGTVTVSISARRGTAETKDLADVVLNWGKDGSTAAIGMIEALGNKGYRGCQTKETANTKEFVVISGAPKQTPH